MKKQLAIFAAGILLLTHVVAFAQYYPSDYQFLSNKFTSKILLSEKKLLNIVAGNLLAELNVQTLQKWVANGGSMGGAYPIYSHDEVYNCKVLRFDPKARVLVLTKKCAEAYLAQAKKGNILIKTKRGDLVQQITVKSFAEELDKQSKAHLYIIHF